MLGRCWLGGRKGIRPVKNWVVGCWRGYLSGAMCRLCIWPSWCHCHSLSLASVKSRLVLPFWYRLTRVVPDKGPLNGLVCVCVCVCVCVWTFTFDLDLNIWSGQYYKGEIHVEFKLCPYVINANTDRLLLASENAYWTCRLMRDNVSDRKCKHLLNFSAVIKM